MQAYTPATIPMRPQMRLAGQARQRLRQRLWRLLRPVRLGVLGGTRPLSTDWGYDRGQPVDRYYIDRFIERHRADIHGRVLEIKDPRYTQRYGQHVTQSDVLDVNERNRRATIVTDLAKADVIPDATFNCCIVTQTLQYIYDLSAAIEHLRRILQPGGVLLVTVPGLTKRVNPEVSYSDSDYWRFTPASCARLFGTVFGDGNVEVESFGNVLTSIAFLSGMAQEELSESDLAHHDDLYPLIVATRAVKR